MIALLMAKRAHLFQRKQILQNMVAGVIVGVVALPLAMAFAIASGAKPEQGLYTAIIAGFITSSFGGSLVQIAGPTGAFIVIFICNHCEIRHYWFASCNHHGRANFISHGVGTFR
jgi:SulP family sulfate permease